MGYGFVALCLFSSTIALTTACDKDEEVEYKEENSPNASTEAVGEAVDLGLSVKWASYNVGANKPEEYGDYFAWGETAPKDAYSWDTYKYGSDKNDLTKYCEKDNKTVLEPSDDAATVNWGNGWRMPTWEELQELRDRCTWTWTTQNGVNGQLVTGPNGNSIFLPAAGEQDRRGSDNVGSAGRYWSSSRQDPGDAYQLAFDSDAPDGKDNDDRCFGYSIRPVRASAQN